jgi:hypothetical protein
VLSALFSTKKPPEPGRLFHVCMAISLITCAASRRAIGRKKRNHGHELKAFRTRIRLSLGGQGRATALKVPHGCGTPPLLARISSGII